MGTVTVDGRGQLVVPREARDALNIQAGDRFVVFGNECRRSLHLVSADYFDSFADMLLSRSSRLERLARDLRGMSWGEGPEEDEGADEGAGARPTDGDASRSTPDAGRPKE
jgi:looped-hinge helix DNA binding domain, AbrB family